jgi:phage uncharacterized protein (putative large terminase), C-terminal domain
VLEALTPAELAEVDALLHEMGPQTFRSFVNSVRPTYQWWRHAQIVGDVIEQVVAGRMTRVIIVMPPRHGKSETVTRLGAGYFLRRHPDKWVGINTYSADLSHVMSRAAKTYYLGRADERELEVEAVKHWETPYGGGMWAAGVGGPITGKGFHLGIIDDPLKNAEEASSPVIRAKQREWWDSTFYTRAEPNAAIIVIATRWHEQDLIGYLLEKESDEPEGWHIIHLAALAEALPPYPTSCIIGPDWRRQGEALCPERYDAAKLEQIKRKIGDYFFSALYQQRPQPREGGLFKREWFDIVEALPPLVRQCRGWDLGATEGGGDPTSGIKIGKDRDGVFYVADRVNEQKDPGARDNLIKTTASLDGKSCMQWGEQEPGAAGKSVAHAFIKMLTGYPCGTTPASGDKVLRANPFAAQASVRNVKILRAPWNRAYLDQLCAFPTGAHDDDVDGSSIAFNALNMLPSAGSPPVSMEQVSRWR